MKFAHLVHSTEPGALQMCVCVCVCVHACLVAHLCLTLYDPMDCSPPGSLSIAFSRQHWSGLPSPPPGGLPDPGIEPASLLLPALAGGYFTNCATWEASSQKMPVGETERWATQQTGCAEGIFAEKPSFLPFQRPPPPRSLPDCRASSALRPQVGRAMLCHPGAHLPLCHQPPPSHHSPSDHRSQIWVMSGPKDQKGHLVHCSQVMNEETEASKGTVLPGTQLLSGKRSS